jgi:hypothetical protein
MQCDELTKIERERIDLQRHRIVNILASVLGVDLTDHIVGESRDGSLAISTLRIPK